MRDEVKGKRLFTVFLELEGTTSVSQFNAASVEEALDLWVENLTGPQDYGLTEDQALRLATAFRSDCDAKSLVPLKGLQRVWCTTCRAGNSLALLNLVETKTGPLRA